MRLLMLTSDLPYPPMSGGALRTFGILKYLHAAGHEVSLLSFHSGGGAPDALSALCKQVFTVPHTRRTPIARLRHLLLSSAPDLAQRMHSDAFKAELKALLEVQYFDVIQFEGIEMATYLPFVRALNSRACLIFDTFNAEYDLQAQTARLDAGAGLHRIPAAYYSHLQAQKLKRYEGTLCKSADVVIAVSQEDADLLTPMCAGKPPRLVPSGIFVENYTTSTAYDLGLQSLVFTGKMDYRPNVDAALWFGKSIFPHILKAIPGAQWYVVGQKPTASVKALTMSPHIHVEGKVPEIVPFLAGAAVYIAPLRVGSGTRLKLLEAMAAGCAIVATSTAAAGLDADTTAAMRLADTEADFAGAVIDLLCDVDKRHAHAVRARQIVQARYDWSTLAPRLGEVYEDIMRG